MDSGALLDLYALALDVAWTLPLAVAAGVLTTLAGIGGGMTLVIVLSAVRDPQLALSLTAPALLVGNLHRLYMLRRDLALGVLGHVLVGVIPGTLLGGALALYLDPRILQWSLVAVAGFAGARELGLVRVTPHPRALIPVVGLGGALTATTGGGGLLIAPSLLVIGLRDAAFVATSAAIASSMHITRLAVYGVGGWLSGQSLAWAVVVALGIVAGNLVGRALRRRLAGRGLMPLTYAVLVVMIALSLYSAATG